MRNIQMLLAGAIGAIAILGSAGIAPAQAQTPAPGHVPAGLEATDKDHILGDPKAPITIVEYASLTCSACAQFHSEVLPALKARHIDTGMVRLIYRDFPLDRVAVQAAQLAECVDRGAYFGVVATIFQSQARWAADKEPLAALIKLLRLAGLGEAQAKACLDDQKGLDAILAEQQGGAALGVDSTPTLFVNGQRFRGSRTPQAFDALFATLSR